ncbi:MAG: MGH1-like glycoside hydrolase domain-containing protein [Acidimicrobiales bacterium]
MSSLGAGSGDWFAPVRASEPAVLWNPKARLSIAPMWYSSALGAVSRFQFPHDDLRLGRFSRICGQASLSGTVLGAEVALELGFSPIERCASIEIQCGSLPQWGLRTWYCFQMVVEDPDASVEIARLDVDDYVAPQRYRLTVDGRSYLVEVDQRAVDVVLHERPDEIDRAFVDHGYYYRVAGGDSPRCLTFRFNALTPSARISVTEEHPPVASEVHPAPSPSSATRAPAIFTEEVISEALGWAEVWDQVHQLPLLASSRRWIDERFGGWNIWQCDGWIHLVMAARIGDLSTAETILRSMHLVLTEEPQLSALMAGTTQWIDRTHPPYGAYAVWEYLETGGDTAIVRPLVEALIGQFFWWFDVRDGNGNGLVEYGSSPRGDGHFVHTLLAAMDEAAMDNSAIFDHVEFDVTTHTMAAEEPGLNALLVVEGELLGRLASRLGIEFDTERAEAHLSRVRSRLPEVLWDSSRSIFALRRWDGAFAEALAPTSFYPLWADTLSDAQAAMLVRHLSNPATFGGGPLVPATNRSHPAARDNTYWRGRIWTPFNLLVYLGLRHRGFDTHATALAISSYRQLAHARARGWLPENFSADGDDERLGPDTEPYYTWGAGMALLPAMEFAHRDRSGEIHLGAGPDTVRDWMEVFGVGDLQGVLPSTMGIWEVTYDGQSTTVRLGGRVVVSARGAIRMVIDADAFDTGRATIRSWGAPLELIDGVVVDLLGEGQGLTEVRLDLERLR